MLHRLHLFDPQRFDWLYPAHKWRAHDNRSGWWVRAAFFPFNNAFSRISLCKRTHSCFPFKPSLSFLHTHSARCLFGVSTRRSLSARWSGLTVAMATRGWSSLIGWPQSRPFRTLIPSPQVPLAVRVLFTSFLFTQTRERTNSTLSI